MANIDVNQTNKHGEGAIHVAAGLGQLDILKMLAAKGGNLGMVDHRGDSAIYWAARQGHEDLIRYLLAQGVHLNQQNKVGSMMSRCFDSNQMLIHSYVCFTICT